MYLGLRDFCRRQVPERPVKYHCTVCLKGIHGTRLLCSTCWVVEYCSTICRDEDRNKHRCTDIRGARPLTEIHPRKLIFSNPEEYEKNLSGVPLQTSDVGLSVFITPQVERPVKYRCTVCLKGIFGTSTKHLCRTCGVIEYCSTICRDEDLNDHRCTGIRGARPLTEIHPRKLTFSNPEEYEKILSGVPLQTSADLGLGDFARPQVERPVKCRCTVCLKEIVGTSTKHLCRICGIFEFCSTICRDDLTDHRCTGIRGARPLTEIHPRKITFSDPQEYEKIVSGVPLQTSATMRIQESSNTNEAVVMLPASRFGASVVEPPILSHFISIPSKKTDLQAQPRAQNKDVRPVLTAKRCLKF